MFQADCLVPDPLASHLGLSRPKMGSELVAIPMVTTPHSAAQLLHCQIKVIKSHYLPSFLSSTQQQQRKGFATNFPRSTDFPAAREGPMTKPFEIPEAIFYLQSHFLLRSLPAPAQCLLLWKVIVSERPSETPPAGAPLGRTLLCGHR